MSIYDNEAENVEFLARCGGPLCANHDEMASLASSMLCGDYDEECVECNPAAQAHWDAHVAACRAAGRWTRYESPREKERRERHEEYVRVHGPIDYGMSVAIPASTIFRNALPIDAARDAMRESMERAMFQVFCDAQKDDHA